MKGQLTEAQNQVLAQKEQFILKLGEQVRTNAEREAALVQPMWKKVAKIVVNIVITVAVTVVSTAVEAATNTTVELIETIASGQDVTLSLVGISKEHRRTFERGDENEGVGYVAQRGVKRKAEEITQLREKAPTELKTQLEQPPVGVLNKQEIGE